MKVAGKIAQIDMDADADTRLKTEDMWIVVADRQVAKILAKHGRKFEVQGLLKPGHQATGLDNDTVGRGAGGGHHHKLDPSMHESRQNEERFAREISHWLEEAANRHAFKRLVLIAAPQMLGQLRAVLGKTTAAHVEAEFPKELTNHADAKLEAELLLLVPGPDKE